MLVSLMMDIPEDAQSSVSRMIERVRIAAREAKIQARMQGITALSDAQFAVFPGSLENASCRHLN